MRRTRLGLEGLSGLLDSRLFGRPRPELLAPGQVVLGQFRIERILRSSESRHLYQVECVEGSMAARQCWECGFEHNLSDDAYCNECGMALVPRSFALSERWSGDFGPFLALHNKGVFHPSLARHYRVFEERNRVYVLTDPCEGGTLAEMSSPLTLEMIVDVGSKIAAALNQLEKAGVLVGTLGKDNIAFNDGAVLLHDPEIAQVYKDGVPPHFQGQPLEQFARILREFVPYDASGLRVVLDEVVEGKFKSPDALVSALEGVLYQQERSTGEILLSAMSDVGMARSLNEDNWGWEKLNPDTSVYAVADGMGGHDSGEIASELAVRTLMREVRRRVEGAGSFSEEILENCLDESFQSANNAVKEFSERRRSDMGTTLVTALLYRGSMAFVANVGDSRAYLFRDGTLKQISMDHSLVANLVAMGKITAEAARSHPHSNILIRTVGKEWDVEIDVFKQVVRSGDRLLLCSDGLWGEVEDQEITRILREFPESRLACRELIRAANQHGGRDNITAVLLKIP